MKNRGSYVLGFQDIDQSKLGIAGGKGANLGELARIAGIQVPDGFCVSTEAFKKIVGEAPKVNELLDQLALLKAEDRDRIGAVGAELRRTIQEQVIPPDIEEGVARFLSEMGETNAFAVRSSATAEDLPTASFAGQQDTYLNVSGKDAILKHISQCWASLYTDRAIIYRLQNGFDHRKVYLAVVIQKMIFPDAAGILFTADPVSANRKILSIDASFGLGEALVSGLVNADHYKVRDGKLIEKQIVAKKLAIYAVKEGGTTQQLLGPDQQNRQALTDEQVLQLNQIGREIEAYFGSPQDIEWCLAGDAVYVVQSRPITTLFPIPTANDAENAQHGPADRDPHIFISVGHQQMMTDPMKPLGLSLWQLTATRPMYQAAGRLFVDVARDLASPAGRELLVNVLGKSDPLIKDALTTLLERGDCIPTLPNDTPEQSPGTGQKGPSPANFQQQLPNDPAIVSGLMKDSEALVETLKHDIQSKSGVDLIDFILDDRLILRQSLSYPQSFGAIMTGINAAAWINEHMQEWLGEKAVADTLAQSAPNNVTSEMGLALLDVADVIRPYPEVIAYLQRVNDDNFLDELVQFAGGLEARQAIGAFLDKYGMRGVGEIDLTRPRWSEKPTTLVPLILSNIKNFEPGASSRKFEQGRQQALVKEQELVDRLKQLPDGEQKAEAAKHQIGLLRNFIGYREYPKYGIVNRYFVYKQALLKEAERLVQAGVIREVENIYYLTFEELREVIRTQKLDHQIIVDRKAAFKYYEKLKPPRVITSDGEIIAGKYKREDLPAGAIAGLAVSAGVIEGRARVILTMEEANIEEGDILITAFTDPSWTPLFVSISGLVTEVGGLMTHGAVIAREYGLPAVVGIDNATQLIKDGQRIRVNGTEGYVEILH
ncbi:phosphoenolpyruvate synthase [Larkinella rosea]|uniref:Prodigiosin synthesizing transferase PigC n=1 Tax=Larkinella rosea TaxID=2025312 RepID=A0A3P1BI41_9BACT|nr:phosphoenolpyruvate synthase [Larkinella rosea]RRB00678.1 phosphoenolpyruvate synthase [Larkinella rosea]